MSGLLKDNPIVKVEHGPGCVVQHFADGQTAIFCEACGRCSWSARDVKERYCGHCAKFHDDVWLAE